MIDIIMHVYQTETLKIVQLTLEYCNSYIKFWIIEKIEIKYFA